MLKFNFILISHNEKKIIYAILQELIDKITLNDQQPSSSTEKSAILKTNKLTTKCLGVIIHNGSDDASGNIQYGNI